MIVDDDLSWLDYELAPRREPAAPEAPAGPGPGGVYVLVRYLDGTADLPSLEEYGKRRETKEVRDARVIRGTARAIEAACQARVLRSSIVMDERQIERVVKQVNNPPERTMIPSIEEEL